MTTVADLTLGASEPVLPETPELPTVRLPAIQVDEAQIHAHLDRVVRQTVEDTLNGLLDAEADRLCGAKRYERSADRDKVRYLSHI